MRRDPNRPPTPGSFFASSLAGAERPISEIAGDLGVAQLLHRVLAEKAPITAAMALRLGKFCDNGPGLWLRMQQAYELWRAQKALQNQLNKIPAAGEAA